jgi:hypothetical protein
LDGTVSDGTWTAELGANRATYSKTNKPPQAGNKYTLAMSAPINGGSLVIGDGASQPGGVGFGTFSVDKLGNLRFRGKLDDGTTLSEGTFVSSVGQWPLYASLYSGNGLVLGWFTFVSQPTNDLSGAVSWIKLAQAKGKLYPGGFTNESGTIGSSYRFTNNLPVFNWTTGQVALVSSRLLSQNLTNRITLSPTNHIWTGEGNLKFKITTPAASFSGRDISPTNEKPISFSGVVLQKQNTGLGYFLGTHEAGIVVVGPAQ